MGRKERAGPPDEKVTINLGLVDLGRVDLLVEEGFYASRTDLIRTAVRKVLDEHKEPLNDAIVRSSWCLGVLECDREYLQELRARDERLKIRVIGLLRFAADVPADLADEVVESIRLLGHFSGPPAVRKRLESKMVKA
jgi:Arc/MetJ-type ribon-helix-helix transcriptional regulator